MATHLTGLLTIALLIRGSVIAGSEESLQRVKRDDDSDERSSSGSTCPCTQGCCDEGWIQYKDACYLPELQQKRSWSNAEEYCVEREAHLASVHSHEEDNFILHLMGNVKLRPYWLGAKRIRQGQERHWMWADESPYHYERVPNFFHPGENKNNLVAGRLNDQGIILWNYEDGSVAHLFICKYSLAP
ncbi:snaclec rhodocetin subunit alpha-like [Eublepharis macularius]|uniref:Snaclec rhodocetin subunit alpha-like n=1 Tax=Eublepharis macularius TaxID=481883 RepID=A0AA97K9K3_EUBMA|nr:snaclec rhodocetin subunit alpha-like [Eublepharis macularius]